MVITITIAWVKPVKIGRNSWIFQDFVDVTLACSDGSTLDAHKVILSSVSTYFRDILKTAPCKHPIIILKDTCKDEASAMLEFAYTGEVNIILM